MKEREKQETQGHTHPPHHACSHAQVYTELQSPSSSRTHLKADCQRGLGNLAHRGQQRRRGTKEGSIPFWWLCKGEIKSLKLCCFISFLQMNSVCLNIFNKRTSLERYRDIDIQYRYTVYLYTLYHMCVSVLSLPTNMFIFKKMLLRQQ